MYVPGEILQQAGFGPDDPPPLYRLWGRKKNRVMVQLYREGVVTVESALAQPTPFLQRFVLLKACGESTNDAAFLARWFEHIGPLDRREGAEVVLAGWRSDG